MTVPQLPDPDAPRDCIICAQTFRMIHDIRAEREAAA